MRAYINKDELDALLASEHRDPHHLLGIHQEEGGGWHVNVFQPAAVKAVVVDKNSGEAHPMEKVHEDGFFTVELPGQLEYKVLLEDGYGNGWETEDPYKFGPVLGELDLYLFGQGTHYEIYEKMGAHAMEHEGAQGVCFSVWAPNAKRVSVIGDFNGWDGRIHPMRTLGQSGIFELFIPGIGLGERYKYEIKTQEGYLLKKSDPYANYSELRPNTASVVADLNSYEWRDRHWQEEKKNVGNLDVPIAIYEVHLGSWKRNGSETGFMNYRDLAHDLVNYVKEMGYTHIELMPVSEHPFDGSWGYQVSGYYAPTSRFGKPEDFMYFVDYCHMSGIGVILDWVPAHFPKDDFALANFDGTALYEHGDPRQGEHPHWGTKIFNYGRNEVKNFLIGNAIFWLEKFHLDGLRVDAVASMLYLDYGKDDGQWIPNPHGGRENLEAVEFFRHLNSVIYGRYKGALMVAEESTSWPGVSRPSNIGGLGFGLKWNMGWMNDFLRYVSKDPIHRKYHHNDLTFGMIYAYTENFVLVLSHDEVVHGKGSMINKMPGDYWQKFANLRLAYGYMYGHPGKKLLFMGGEFAQFDEWTETKSLDWHLLEFEKHREMQQFVKDLNYLYVNEPACWYDDFTEAGFEWINCSDYEASIVSFVRKGEHKTDTLVFVANYTPVPRTMHRVGVPYKGSYLEIMNSDEEKYGGSGTVNADAILTEKIEWDGRDHSLSLKVPPLGITVLKYLG
ncbi:1,4-alpha-glucan branching protein GlgB [Clostridiales bacterium F-3ap]|uniref:1,4-alpha-glucan branching enzyme GlgB n=1 Tax=Anaerotalea alkaliphila TaxID=2662126 RepID=A0A7X5HUH5_9FIRM|nr:1,4-alpha-glucan branching protein GlgB [Anaerotalea alkaliphila]